jgi:hypothetical protein
LLYGGQQGWKAVMHGAPNEAPTHILVVMPVDIASPGHLIPWNIRVPCLHVIREPPRRFGDDFQSPRHGIKDKVIVAETVVIEATDESARKMDVVPDIKQPLLRGRRLRAFSGKVDTGFPSENATNKEQLERFPIQPDREAL